MPSKSATRLGRICGAAALSLGLSGCLADRTVTGSITPTSASREVALDASPESREARWRALAAKYAPIYDKDPDDAANAYAYGVTLRALGQRAQALAVLEAASLKNPRQSQILAAYGRALSDVGRYEDALRVLERAHTPDRPDWRILNAQGAILDQLGRSVEARGHYEAALKMVPGEPAVLSNLGLSYALAKDLAKAEATLAAAAASPKADDKIRANLAMVRGLRQGDPVAPRGAKPQA
jgi:Flp pilus assembly protein TadD